MPSPLPPGLVIMAVVSIVVLFLLFAAVLLKLLDARFGLRVANSVIGAVTAQRDRAATRADAAEKALETERDAHRLAVDNLNRGIRAAAEEIDLARVARDEALRDLALERAESESAAQKRGNVVLELAHRLEHAEQSVREGTARAVRDHADYQLLLREAVELRARHTAALADRDLSDERWKRAADAALAAETQSQFLATRLAGAVAALRLVVNQAVSEQTAPERDAAETAARHALALPTAPF